MAAIEHLRRVMRDNNLDYEQVSVGLNWGIGEVVTLLHGYQNPTEKQKIDIENWITESGLDVIKVRKWGGQFVTSNPELSKILEDYYANLKK